MVFEMSTVLGLIRMTGSRTANVGWPTFGVKRTVSWERADAIGATKSSVAMQRVNRMFRCRQEAGGRKQEAGKERNVMDYKRFVPPRLAVSCLLPPASFQ